MSDQYNITAIIYDKRGRIVSMGKNSYVKTHPLQARLAEKAGLKEKIFLHAEVDALVKLKDWTRGHRMLITRYGRAGNPLNARPCPVCQEALKLAGIRHVDHT